MGGYLVEETLPTMGQPAARCAPEPSVSGDRLSCDRAIALALAQVGEDAPAIRDVSFSYGPCGPATPATMTVFDCAVQLSGTVTIHFEGEEPPVTVHVLADDTGKYVAKIEEVTVIPLPASGQIDGLKIATVTVDGLEYQVSVGRGFDLPADLIPIGVGTLSGRDHEVFRIPGVSPQAALAIRSVPGDGDDLGPYPDFHILVGPEGLYPALCPYVGSRAAPAECR